MYSWQKNAAGAISTTYNIEMTNHRPSANRESGMRSGEMCELIQIAIEYGVMKRTDQTTRAMRRAAGADSVVGRRPIFGTVWVVML
jgi:hypothetical protein